MTVPAYNRPGLSLPRDDNIADMNISMQHGMQASAEMRTL